MKGFIDFIREQGIVGLAIGFILGGTISKVVTALVTDLVNPLLGLLLGRVGNLDKAYLQIASVKFLWGDFVSNVIDLLVIALIIYIGSRILRLERLDKKKSQ